MCIYRYILGLWATISFCKGVTLEWPSFLQFLNFTLCWEYLLFKPTKQPLGKNLLITLSQKSEPRLPIFQDSLSPAAMVLPLFPVKLLLLGSPEPESEGQPQKGEGWHKGSSGRNESPLWLSPTCYRQRLIVWGSDGPVPFPSLSKEGWIFPCVFTQSAWEIKAFWPFCTLWTLKYLVMNRFNTRRLKEAKPLWIKLIGPRKVQNTPKNVIKAKWG